MLYLSIQIVRNHIAYFARTNLKGMDGFQVGFVGLLQYNIALLKKRKEKRILDLDSP